MKKLPLALKHVKINTVGGKTAWKHGNKTKTCSEGETSTKV